MLGHGRQQLNIVEPGLRNVLLGGQALHAVTDQHKNNIAPVPQARCDPQDDGNVVRLANRTKIHDDSLALPAMPLTHQCRTRGVRIQAVKIDPTGHQIHLALRPTASTDVFPNAGRQGDNLARLVVKKTLHPSHDGDQLPVPQDSHLNS